MLVMTCRRTHRGYIITIVHLATSALAGVWKGLSVKHLVITLYSPSFLEQGAEGLGGIMPTRVLSILHWSSFSGPHNHNLQIAPLLECYGFQTVVVMPSGGGNAPERFRRGCVVYRQIRLGTPRKSLNIVDHIRYFSGFVGDVRRLRVLIRELKIDIVQLNGLVTLQGAVAAKLEGARINWMLVDTFAPKLLRWPLSWLVSMWSEAIMTTGRTVASAHWPIAKDDPRVIPFHPPIDVERFAPSASRRRDALEVLGIAPSEIVVGMVANFIPVKGHRVFIEAAGQVADALGGRCRFVLLGSTYRHFQDYVDELWQLAQGVGLRRGGNLIARDGGADIPRLIHSMDVFWMTSLSEGSPTTVLEAMAAGVATVAANVGAVGEVIDHGQSGYLASPGDPRGFAELTMHHLSRPERERRALSEEARERVRSLAALEVCVQHHLHAYALAGFCSSGASGGPAAGPRRPSSP